MSRPYTANRIVTTQNLDMEEINDNFDNHARCIQSSLDRRYSYSTHTYMLDGVTNASDVVLRTVPIRRPKVGNSVEVCGVEVVIYAAGTEVWTLACSDTTWPSITVTAAEATTEASASSGTPVNALSESSDLTFTMSCPNASTITRGYVVVKLRCDRGQQGTSYAGFTPTLLDSTSSTAGSTLDTLFTAFDAAVARDTAANINLKCQSMTARNFSATVPTMRIVTGQQMVIHRVTGYVVAAVGANLAVSLSGASIDTVAFTVTAGGATTLASSGADAGTDATVADSPGTAAQDLVLTLTRSGAGTILLAHVLVWYS